MKKYLIILGHLSLLITALLAVIFYKERVFFVDPGQQLFEMINEGGYKIFVKRYSMAINQTIPLIAIKLGLSLKTIVIAYSLSFIAIFYLCFVISVYNFKNVAAGLAIAWAPLFIRLAFGHSISEAWLGVAYSVLFYALLNYYDIWKKKGPLFIVLFYFLIILIFSINYFIHPITLFTISFAIGFTYFYKKAYKQPYIYIVALISILPYIYKFIFPSHTHEENFFAGIKIADKLLPHIMHLPLWEFLTISFFKIYFIGAILLLFIGFWTYRKKQLLVLAFIVGFIFFYFIIACLAFYKGDSPFALESRLIPIVFMVVIPFVEYLKEQKRNYIVIIGLMAILTFSFIDLSYQVKLVHTKRLSYYESVLNESQQYPEQKFYVRIPEGKKTPVNSWGSGVETLLLTSIEGKENSRTVIFVKRDLALDEGLKYWPCVFLWVPWYMFYPEEFLNKNYFDLKCTAYREIAYKDIY
jgi:hypothetical protein